MWGGWYKISTAACDYLHTTVYYFKKFVLKKMLHLTKYEELATQHALGIEI
jgi:hypothetical protein